LSYPAPATENTLPDLHPALFLDRDGVINEDFGFVHRTGEFELVSGVTDLIKAANQSGFRVIVVTNQSGIGRGIFTEEDFHRLTAHMRAVIEEAGGHIDAVYFCPHHPTDAIGAYRQACDCRKPAPGMVLQAAREHDLDLRQSLLVGDSARDIEAGQAAGVGQTYLYSPSDRPTPKANADAIVDQLANVIQRLK
jgi:D-glycero-D-manno-heptose 1,7-bisphosphate phosphatase